MALQTRQAGPTRVVRGTNLPKDFFENTNIGSLGGVQLHRAYTSSSADLVIGDKNGREIDRVSADIPKDELVKKLVSHGARLSL